MVHEWLDGYVDWWVADLGGHVNWDNLLPTSPKSVPNIFVRREDGWMGWDVLLNAAGEVHGSISGIRISEGSLLCTYAGMRGSGVMR